MTRSRAMRAATIPALAAMASLGFTALAAGQATDKAAPPPKAQAPIEAAKPKGVSKIERYARVLGLDKAQTDAARDLYDAYVKETQAAAKKMRETMKDAQEDMNSGDRAEFERGVQKNMAEHRETSRKVTDSFLADLRDLLRPDQQSNWPAFERFRRREKYLNAMMGIGGMGVGGSSVDLFPVIEKLGVPADAKPKVDEALSRYEVDMDRPLKEREQNTEDEQKQMGAVQHFDRDSFTRKLERDRRVDLQIREVNTRYVREIAALLPDELAKKLNDAYQARAYRSIYRESSVSKRLASALQVKDLSADQRARLQALADSYKRDARAANDRWAAAQEKAETAGRPTGGGLLMLGPGDSGAEKIDPDVADARSGRRDLDNAARDQLGKILTPDQLASLPDPNAMRGGAIAHRVAVFGDGTGDNMVLVDDLDLGDDAPPADGAPVMIIRTVTGQGHGPEGGDQTSRPARSRPAP